MVMIVHMTLCVASLLCIGCSHCTHAERVGRVPWQSAVPRDDWRARAAELASLDPEATARAMFAANKATFVGINSFTPNITVGVNLTEDEECRYPSIPIEGTSDSPTLGDMYAFQTAADTFAIRFNRAMLEFVRRR